MAQQDDESAEVRISRGGSRVIAVTTGIAALGPMIAVLAQDGLLDKHATSHLEALTTLVLVLAALALIMQFSVCAFQANATHTRTSGASTPAIPPRPYLPRNPKTLRQRTNDVAPGSGDEDAEALPVTRTNLRFALAEAGIGPPRPVFQGPRARLTSATGTCNLDELRTWPTHVDTEARVDDRTIA